MQSAFYLARHGETVWNHERRFQGQMDSSLTPLGLAQARRMGLLLRSLGIDPSQWTIVASPLPRAHQTAAIIAGVIGYQRSRIETDARLMELNLGCWEGLTLAEIEERTPNLDLAAPHSEIFFKCPDGETYEAFMGRITDWMADVRQRDDLIVVAHGLVGRLIRGLYAGLSRHESLVLPVPQDALFHLRKGVVERFDWPEKACLML
jgi:broad specificity phosphatase PhoE